MVDWETRYAAVDADDGHPAQVLSDFLHMLPVQGIALDLACGLGANARLLARRGLDVYAWDSAASAIEALRMKAEREAVLVHASVRDVLVAPPEPESFDVIVVSRFLGRELMPRLALALRPGGLLYYQTFVREAVDNARGPRRPEYRLDTNELLRFFPGLRVIAYREEGCIGDLAKGLRNEAYAVFHRIDHEAKI